MVQREESIQARLARAGFRDCAQAARLISDALLANVDLQWLIDALSRVSDPDLALLGYLRLTESIAMTGKPAHDALYHVCESESGVRALFAILGYSSALSEFLIAHPQDVTILAPEHLLDSPLTTDAQIEREKMQAAIVPTLADIRSASGETQRRSALADAVGALRRQYWQRITQIAAQDLVAVAPVDDFPQISLAISQLIDAALDGALAIAQAVVTGAEHIEMSVIAMGKTGAQEINYISDVDVIYLAAPTKSATSIPESELVEIGTKVATVLARVVSEPSKIPPLWEIDANLRPEGKDGTLVRTLDSYLNYYRRWAKGWEFQALLKARPAAGNLVLGQQLVDALQEKIWGVAGNESFVEDSQAMRRRVLEHVPAHEAPRQLKLGKGGLRDIEFTVQLLQLVHGRTDTTLRCRSTLAALTALSDGGYISRSHATQLAQYYKFLRTLEHRVQLFRFRRSHLVPKSTAELQRIAASLAAAIPEIRDADDLERYWQKIRADVRALHLEIYYRPLIPAVAKLSADEVTLEPHAAQARLAAIGYRDPRGALTHIRALTAGISRTAMIQRHLLPVLIGWFGAGPNPDQGLRSFRVLSEQMGATPWYMRTLRDSSVAAERLAKILSCAKYVAEQLPKLSEAISWLDDDALLAPRTRSELQDELDSLLSRRNTPEEISLAGRYLRRKELLRTALAQLLGLIDETAVQRAICAAGEIAIDACYRAARQKICTAHGFVELPFEFAVIALGRFGGEELSYASDADVIFVHQSIVEDDAQLHAGVDIGDTPAQSVNIDALAIELAREFIALLGGAGAEPPFIVDPALRPEGKNGPLSRSLDSYSEYYARWVELWERQALLRARCCGGSTKLGAQFCDLINPLRYPAQGLDQSEIRTIRTMKVRVENERISRAADAMRHLKLGPGGLSDIEWTVQYLQLLNAGKNPELRQLSTLKAIDCAQKAALLTASEAKILQQTWIFASRLRDANFLGTGRAQASKVDLLPIEPSHFATVAAIVGYPPDRRQDLDDDYLRLARQTRAIVEHVFYGD